MNEVRTPYSIPSRARYPFSRTCRSIQPKKGRAEEQVEQVQAEGGAQIAQVHPAGAQRRAHAFEDVGRGERPGHHLKPARQDVHRVEDRGDRLDQERHAPDQRLGRLAPIRFYISRAPRQSR